MLLVLPGVAAAIGVSRQQCSYDWGALSGGGIDDSESVGYRCRLTEMHAR